MNTKAVILIALTSLFLLAGGCQNAPVPVGKTKLAQKRDFSQQDIHSFFAAVKRGSCTEVQKYLDEGIGVNIRNNEVFGGKTPLMVASRRMNLKMAKFLIENGATVNILDGRKLDTPLTEACKVKKKNTCEHSGSDQ